MVLAAPKWIDDDEDTRLEWLPSLTATYRRNQEYNFREAITAVVNAVNIESKGYRVPEIRWEGFRCSHEEDSMNQWLAASHESFTG